MFEGEAQSERTILKSSSSGTAESRRSFLGVLLGLGSFVIGGLLSVPLIRFALFPLLHRTTETKNSPLGKLNEFSSLTEPVMHTIQMEQVDGWRRAGSRPSTGRQSARPLRP